VAGEALEGWSGEPVAVLANLPEADTATWNLEVQNEHVYRVGHSGILVHDTCPTPKELSRSNRTGSLMVFFTLARRLPRRNKMTDDNQMDREDFDSEAEQSSIAKLRVVDQTGELVAGARVELHISTAGLLSLGKALIRLSESPDGMAHLRQSLPGCAVCFLGLYLQTESAEMLILKHEFGLVSDVFGLSTPDSPPSTSRG
jgi:hypothetical protein